jgi:hypothetical protein
MTYKHKTTETQAKLGSDNKYYIHNCSIGIPKQFIEDSSVWEKVDGYEILTFKSNRLSFYVPAIQKDGTYLDNPIMSCDGEGAPLEWMLKEPEYYISSIKRLSDGAVFSIGDKVRFSKDYNSFTVEKITLKDNRLELYGDGLFCSVVESNVYKVMPVILTTKDGTELFENDTYYSLGTPGEHWRIQKHSVGYMEIGGFSAVGGDLIFAKKENAEKYIKENKPQYSLNDIKETVKKLGCFGTTLIEYLENNGK